MECQAVHPGPDINGCSMSLVKSLDGYVGGHDMGLGSMLL